jgi:glutamate-5-semialdehyde dehydrogenase
MTVNTKNIIQSIGERARIAADKLVNINGDIKNKALKKTYELIHLSSLELIEENNKDIQNAKSNNLSTAMIDRLTFTQSHINNIILSLKDIIKLENPTGKILSEWTRPNGLHIQKVSVPIGVIGVIYESRPNVTVDASAIAMKAGNAVILRGGRDSFHTSTKLCQIINEAFTNQGMPEHTVQMIPVADRSAVDEMLRLNSCIDIIIPRGGKDLIKAVKEKSSIPVIKHSDGICHIYIDSDADLKKAKEIVYNSKMRRPGICGAAETLLIDKSLSNQAMEILNVLKEANCEIRGDQFISELDKSFKLAVSEDWDTEYLDKIISVKIVEDIDEAIEHINRHSSHHTESIITEDNKKSHRFFQLINSAIVLQNASTQFADGGEFGFGAEIGISTDKLHVRGPVGAEHLTSFKYVVRGNGQVRP